MKITDVRVRLFEMPMERPFHPTWEPFPIVSALWAHDDDSVGSRLKVGAYEIWIRWLPVNGDMDRLRVAAGLPR